MSGVGKRPGKPQRLSHYELRETIGAGGMGTVFRAIDRRSGVAVALKVVHPHLQEDQAYVERFRREAHIASLLSSPYVVRVLDFGLDRGQYFMVSEYVEGVKLGELMRAGRMDPLQALAITVQVALALDEAEGRGIVHRDIKPDNIIITQDRSVKVLDFGIARQTGVAAVTMTGVFVGTISYAAPEMFSGHADVRSDMYSLGITLFHMLAGELPFQAATPTGLMRLHEDAPPPLEKLAGLPAQLVDLVAKMLAKRPEDRYQHVSELLAAIEQVRQVLTGARTESWMFEATSVLAATRIGTPPTGATRLSTGATNAPSGGAANLTGGQTQLAGSALASGAAGGVVGGADSGVGAAGGAGFGGGAPPAAPSLGASDNGNGRRILIAAAALGVVAIGVAVGVMAFGGSDDGGGGGSELTARQRERTRTARAERSRIDTPDDPAPSRTPRPSATTASEPPTTTPAGSRVTAGTWNYSFVITFTDCPQFSTGQDFTFEQEFVEIGAADGYVSDGESFSIIEQGFDIGTFTFSYPVFIIDYFDGNDVYNTLELRFSGESQGVAKIELSTDYDSDADGEDDAVCYTEAKEAGFPG